MNKSNTLKIRPSVVLIMLICTLVAYGVVNRIWLEEWRANREAEKRELAGAQPRTGGRIGVNYLIISPENFDELIVVTGTLVSNEQADLRCEASGKVTEINFVEGSRVKKGQKLLKINDKDLQAQYERAVHQEKLATERERRQYILLKKDAISQEEYDVALTELNSLKAETELIEAQIERTEISAPFDGVVGLRSVSVGEYISPQITVARIVNNNPIKLDFSVPEKYYGVVKPNSTVNFKIDGDEKLYTATVYAIEPQIDITTRTIQMRALAPNPDGKLFPGTSASVQFAMTPLKNAILVPSEALLSEASGHKAYVYKSGQAELRELEIGARTNKEVHILKGLHIGDTLVVSGILQIRQGADLQLNTRVE